MKSERIKEVFSGFKAMGRLGNGRAPMGFKLSGKRGKNRCALPDPVQRRIMGEIVLRKKATSQPLSAGS